MFASPTQWAAAGVSGYNVHQVILFPSYLNVLKHERRVMQITISQSGIRVRNPNPSMRRTANMSTDLELSIVH